MRKGLSANGLELGGAAEERLQLAGGEIPERQQVPFFHAVLSLQQMMRVLLLICLACSGCEDDGPLDSEKDMAINPDLHVAADTCAAAVQCSMACMGAGAASCSAMCFAKVGTAGMPFSQALLGCIQMKCTSLGGDAGTPACDDPQSMTCGACVQSKCIAEATACLQH